MFHVKHLSASFGSIRTPDCQRSQTPEGLTPIAIPGSVLPAGPVTENYRVGDLCLAEVRVGPPDTE